MATTKQGTSTAVSLPRPSIWRQIRQARTAFFYLIPALAVMLAMTFFPLVYQAWMSFTDYGVIKSEGKQTLNSVGPNGQPPPNYRPAEGVGFENYRKILTNDPTFVAQLGTNFNFWRMLAFNLWWTFSNVFFHVALGVVIAVVLNIEGIWFRSIWRTIYILPMVLPNIVIASVWRNMFDEQFGAINQMLKIFFTPFGFAATDFNIRWFNDLQDPIPGLPLSYFAMLIANVWLGWPFMTIVATGALQSIPKELYEAASIDGATGLNQFWKITLPLLRPAMIPAAMVGMVTTFNLFHVVYFMSGGGPLGRTEILVTQAYKLINVNQLYGMAAAFSVLIALILAPIFLVTNRISRATESYDV